MTVRRSHGVGRFRRPGAAPPDDSLVVVCANFEPYRVTQARHLAMLSRHELAERIGVTAERVGRWEFAISVPTPLQLAKLSEVLEYPVLFFARGRPMYRLDSGDVYFCEV